jgi:hypothetical protein
MKEEGLSCNELLQAMNMGVLHHYEPASKRQRIEWEHTSTPRTKKFRSVPSASKVVSMPFWDINLSILVHHQHRGQAEGSTRFYTMLVIRSKHRGMVTNTGLHHDNTQPYYGSNDR